MKALQETLKDSQLKFEQFVDLVDRQKISEIAIRRAMKNYAIKNLKIKNVTPIRAKKMYEILFQKYTIYYQTDTSVVKLMKSAGCKTSGEFSFMS